MKPIKIILGAGLVAAALGAGCYAWKSAAAMSAAEVARTAEDAGWVNVEVAERRVSAYECGLTRGRPNIAYTLRGKDTTAGNRSVEGTWCCTDTIWFDLRCWPAHEPFRYSE